MSAPSGPGLGVELSQEKLDRYKTDSIRDAYLDAEAPGWFPVKPQY